MKNGYAIALLSLLLTTTAIAQERPMKISITANGKMLSATLTDGTAAQDFYNQLPLELELSDYAGSEKISYLPRKLDTSREPDGVSAKVGDINYYAPWGNMAIFYKPHGKARGLVHLGKFDGDFSAILNKEKTKVRFEKAK